jgi:hypothetical protein
VAGCPHGTPPPIELADVQRACTREQIQFLLLLLLLLQLLFLLVDGGNDQVLDALVLFELVLHKLQELLIYFVLVECQLR